MASESRIKNQGPKFYGLWIKDSWIKAQVLWLMNQESSESSPWYLKWITSQECNREIRLCLGILHYACITSFSISFITCYTHSRVIESSESTKSFTQNVVNQESRIKRTYDCESSIVNQESRTYETLWQIRCTSCLNVTFYCKTCHVWS